MADADSSATEIQRLYDISTALDNDISNIATDASKYEKMYEEILQGCKGAQKTKILAAQFIPKYLKHFPKYTSPSIDCLIDLCEEEEMSTRVSAIRAFPLIAKINPESLPKLADILGQLLQAGEQTELDRVKDALVSLLQQDIEVTLTSLFTQSQSDDEDLRVKAISFIFEKVLPLRNEINKNEGTQKSVAENIKKVLPHVSSTKEFQMFMDLLSGLNIYAKGPATNELLDLLADLNAEFNASEQAQVAKLVACLQSASELLKRGASSERFNSWLVEKVLKGFNETTEQLQVDLIQQLALVTPFLRAAEAKALLPSLYELLLSQLPTPPASGADEPKLNFSITEAALYIFHLLAAKAPGLLRGLCGINVVTGQPSSMETELAVDKKEDLHSRLKYLEQRTKSYIDQMGKARKTLAQKGANPDEAEKRRLIEAALKTTHNVLQLAQNLLQRQPSFAVKITPSFTTKKQQATIPSASPSSSASSSPKPAPKGNNNNTARPLPPLKKDDKNATTGARPNFGKAYVPPHLKLQQGGGKKRDAAATADGGEGGEQAQAESQKRFKGRGNSKFQN